MIYNEPGQDGRLNYVHNVLARVTIRHYPYPFSFRACREGDVIKFCFSAYVPDNTSEVAAEDQECEWHNGRGFVIEDTDSERSIVRSALLAVLTYQEHELREQFTYKEEALYEPDHS